MLHCFGYFPVPPPSRSSIRWSSVAGGLLWVLFAFSQEHHSSTSNDICLTVNCFWFLSHYILSFFFYSRGLKFPLILLSSSHLYFTLPCLCFTTLLFLLNSPLLNCTLTVQLHFAINRLHKSILLLQCTGHHLVVVHCSSLTFVYLLPATKQLYSGFFIFFKVALKS